MKRIATTILILFLFGVSAFAADFVASKNSDKYHVETCRLAKKIKDDNMVTFSSPDEAANSGYVACKVCKPPVATNVEK